MTQWICNGGCPRSGTTAFLEVFNEHPNIGMFPEYNFYTLIDKFDDIFYKERNTREKGWIGNINVNDRPGATVITKDFLKYIPQKELGHQRLMMKALFEAVFPGKDLTVIGEKLPFYFDQDIYKLNKRVGPIKFVHITRNPMWVMNSFRHRTKLVEEGKDLWKFRDFGESINIWIRAWNFMAVNIDKYEMLPIKYEDFFEYPEESKKEVFDFLDVPHADIPDFVGKKYGELHALTTQEHDAIQKIFGPLIEVWDEKSMSEIISSHGPFTQEMVNERLK